jgi:hypothetical protein
MLTHVTFHSDQFPAYDGEEREINPGIFGKRVAEFLADGLRARGFEPGKSIPEDWGWIVPIKNDGFKLWIGCGNQDGQPDAFLCFIETRVPIFRQLFKKIDTRPHVESLQKAMDAILSAHPCIRDKHWLTFEEFYYPQCPDAEDCHGTR